MPDFIQLNRTFSSFTSNSTHSENGEIDWEQYMFSGSTASSWNDLLKKRNVVILAEAGAGKTEELRAITTQLHNDGLPAFFCRLEGLLEDDFDVQDWEIGSSRAFDQWRRDDSVVAYFFLDSVDEARLVDQRAFWRALRRFVRVIGRDHLHRAHVYVTSRFSEWRPSEDLKTFRDAFSLSDSAVESEEPESDIVYKLDALSNEQIRHFASTQQVVEPQAFIDEIERADARLFAGRPQDLLDLIAYWQGNNQQLGSYGEIVAFSIDKKLQERNPDRATQTGLTLEKTYIGVSYLAAAVTFTKNNKIALPSSSNSPSDHLDVQRVLRSWTRENIEGLLSRPLFDEAIYGAVRFHHRSVREYLTAKWLYGLLEQGAPRHKIEALLIAEQYGVKVAIPSMQVVAAWLAFFDERFRSRLMDYAPEVLIQHGDPSVFPLEFRIRLLDGVIEKYQDQQRTDLYIDPAMMTRLSEPDMANAINQRLEEWGNHHDLGRLLLSMIEFGNVTASTETAIRIALNSEHADRIRKTAFRVVLSIATEQQRRRMVSSLLAEGDVGCKILRSELNDLFPEYLSVDELVRVVAVYRNHDRYSPPDVQYVLVRLTDKQYSDDMLLEILEGFLSLIQQEPLGRNYHDYGVSQGYGWVTKVALGFCAQLFERFSAVRNHESVFKLLWTYLQYTRHRSSSDPVPVIELLKVQRDIAYQFFWYVAHLTQGHYFPATFYRDVEYRVNGLWKVQLSDWDALVDTLHTRETSNEKLVAFSTLYKLFSENGEIRERLNVLQQIANQYEELGTWLDVRLNPPPLTPEQLSQQREDEEYAASIRLREEEQQANRQEWVEGLQEEVAGRGLRLGDPLQGHVYQSGHHLFNILTEIEPRHTQWSVSQWHLLIDEFGQDVAEAFRNGCIGYWRHYDPFFEVEFRTSNSVEWARLIGLSGLAMEAKQFPDWVSALSEVEAQRAAKYSILEMNGFPRWLSDLQRGFPQIVHDVLIDEVAYELSGDFSRGYSKILQGMYFQKELDVSMISVSLLDVLEAIPLTAKDECVEYALGIVLKNELSRVLESRLVGLACRNFSQCSLYSQKIIWLQVLLLVRANIGLRLLQTWLSGVPNKDDQRKVATDLLGRLLEERGSHINVDSPSFYQSYLLACLLELFFRYIRYEEDIHREPGTYSPGSRDHAQDVRSNLINKFSAIPGQYTYSYLIRWTSTTHKEDVSDYFLRLAKHRAEADAECDAWQAEDVARFTSEHAVTPRSEQALYRFAATKLEELKAEYEQGDDSIARTMQRIDQETELRNYLAHQLRQRAHGHYEVPQEEEMPDATRPDLKFRVTGVQPIPVELKIVDNWSFNELNERLENQLLGQYMRTSKYGIYLLVFRGEKSYWQDQGNNQYSFNEMLNVLRQQADLLLNTHSRLEGINVIGIDLKRRFSS